MDVRIRNATIADYNALCALFEQVDHLHAIALPDIFRPSTGSARERDHIQRILDDVQQRLLVAEVGNDIIGVAEANVREALQWPMVVPRRWVHVRDIVVDERFRGQGFGKALLAHIEAWARSLGIMRVELQVWEFNAGARTAYEHAGFRTASRVLWKDLEP
jgi:diamine N-acetyltransferase